MTGISPYPRDIIIDQNGIIAYMHSEYDPQYMLKTVNSLLGLNTIEDGFSELIPQNFDMKIYPNPFNPTTSVSFNIIEAVPVRLEIYNMLGQKIQSQQFENYSFGEKATISVNMENIPTGIYFLAVSNGRSSKTHNLLLLR